MRRGLGVGRALIVVGAVLSLLGILLPWVSAGGATLDLPVVTRNGLEGTGILLFVGVVALLVVVVLPYATSTGRSRLDRPATYVLLAGMAVVGLVVEVVRVWTADALQLWPPDRAPGIWLSIIGVAIIAWGVGEILGDRPAKPPLRDRR